MKNIQGLHSVEDTQKELVVCFLNDLVMDAFKDNSIEVLVNIQPDGKPMAEDGGKILTVGFFIRNVFSRYIDVKDDSPAKMFMRCSEILYKMLTQGD